MTMYGKRGKKQISHQSIFEPGMKNIKKKLGKLKQAIISTLWIATHIYSGFSNLEIIHVRSKRLMDDR